MKKVTNFLKKLTFIPPMILLLNVQRSYAGLGQIESMFKTITQDVQRLSWIIAGACLIFYAVMSMIDPDKYSHKIFGVIKCILICSIATGVTTYIAQLGGIG